MATEEKAEEVNATSEQSEENKEGEKGKEIYASGIPAKYDEDAFRGMFEKFCTRGQITKCRFRKHVVGSQTGYGFITFSNADDAKDAIQEMNGQTLKGELVKVTDSASPNYGHSKTNLYIEGVPTNWSEEQLRELFEGHGEVTETRILVNRKTNEKTGVGFIHFKTEEQAKIAIQSLDGQKACEDAEKTLSVRFAKIMGRRRGGGKNRREGRHGNQGGQSWGGVPNWGYPGFGGQGYGGYNPYGMGGYPAYGHQYYMPPPPYRPY